MTYETISIEQRGPVDWLTLNRPDALNSINNQMVADLSDYFGRLFNARHTRIVVMKGAGRAYCAGARHQGAGHPGSALRRRLRLSGLAGGRVCEDAGAARSQSSA